jgi:hypothetical protein
MGADRPASLLDAVAMDPILAPHAADLRALARNSIRLRVDNTAARSVGESRVGGPPATPVGFNWPRRRVDMPHPGKAWLESRYFPPRLLPADGLSTFEFVAQVDLAEMAPFDVDRLLPPDGRLLFFYDEIYTSDVAPENADASAGTESLPDGTLFRIGTFGFDRIDQVRVLHVAAGAELVSNGGGPHPAQAQRLVGDREWTLPSVDAYVVADDRAPADERHGRVVLSAEAWSRLAGFGYEWRANDDIDQMLGWADNFAHGPSLPPEVADLRSLPPDARLRETQEARLLIQLSPRTYEPTGFRFGRTFFVYARESDLRRGDFSRAWYDSD